MPRFLFITGAFEGKELSPDGDRLLLGRSPECDIRCDAYKDLRVGKVHAEVVADGTRWLLRDLRSRNGTLLNGEAVAEAPLEDGDEIQLGSGGPKLLFHSGVAVSGSYGAASTDGSGPGTPERLDAGAPVSLRGSDVARMLASEEERTGDAGAAKMTEMPSALPVDLPVGTEGPAASQSFGNDDDDDDDDEFPTRMLAVGTAAPPPPPQGLLSIPPQFIPRTKAPSVVLGAAAEATEKAVPRPPEPTGEVDDPPVSAMEMVFGVTEEMPAPSSEEPFPPQFLPDFPPDDDKPEQPSDREGGLKWVPLLGVLLAVAAAVGLALV